MNHPLLPTNIVHFLLVELGGVFFKGDVLEPVGGGGQLVDLNHVFDYS